MSRHHSPEPPARFLAAAQLGALARFVPATVIDELLRTHGKVTWRERRLPMPFLVYYVIALGLFMDRGSREVLRALLEGLRTLDPTVDLAVAGKAAICQARIRLGPEVLRDLYGRLVRPIGTAATGAFYRRWRVMGLDGTLLAVARTPETEAAYGLPSGQHGNGAFPQMRVLALVETGTHLIWRIATGSYFTGETTLAATLVTALTPAMLCLADRCFFHPALWHTACATGAALVWRVKASTRLPVEQPLADGSYLSSLPGPEGVGRTVVRVIRYALVGVPHAEPEYRLVTNLLDPAEAPAADLAALYHERWEVESAFDELKTHLRGGAAARLRSERLDLIEQELYGLLLAHALTRQVIQEAATVGGRDPDTVSFTHTVRVLRRRLPQAAALSPSAPLTLVDERAA